MSNRDWGGSDWWEIWPDPPGEDDDREGTYSAGSGEGDSNSYNSPLPGNSLDASSWEISLGEDGDIVDIRSFMLNPDNVDPSKIRGIGFTDPGEAISWLYSLGLLGFSDIIEIDDIWFPVIGDSDETAA